MLRLLIMYMMLLGSSMSVCRVAHASFEGRDSSVPKAGPKIAPSSKKNIRALAARYDLFKSLGESGERWFV